MSMYKTYKDSPDLSLESKRMSDSALSEFLDARVVVCSDVILYNKTKKVVYLATRIHKPAEGLWVIGGQTKRGERAEQTAMRRLQAETGLSVDEDRLQFLTIIESQWSYRAEPEQNNGRHDLTRVFAVEISDDERLQAEKHLDSQEYDVSAGLKSCTREELVSAGAREVILDYYNLIFAT